MTVLFNILAIALIAFGVLGMYHAIKAVFENLNSFGPAMMVFAICFTMVVMAGIILIVGAPA